MKSRHATHHAFEPERRSAVHDLPHPFFALPAVVAFSCLAAAGGCAGEPGTMTSQSSSSTPGAAQLEYPQTPRVEQTDDYHGTRVADPYRWLEDPDSEETRAWIEAQNEVAFQYLESIPERERIRRRLETVWDYERYGVPFFRGGRYFFMHNNGLQNQNVLYTTERLDAEPRILLDPNELSEDGTVALAMTAVSRDSRHLAYGLSSAGSDWLEFKVRDVATGKDLPDHLKWIKFSGATWSTDGSGFYYSRYDEPDPDAVYEQANYYQKVYFHRLGTDQGEDRLVYQRSDQKEWGFDSHVTEDGSYLVLHVWQGTDPKNGVFYRDLKAGGGFVELLAGFDASYEFLGNEGSLFWFRSDLEAPRQRIIGIDVRKPARASWIEIIPQSEATLEGATVIADRFVALYLRDVRSEVKIYGLDGRLEKTLELPGLGTAHGFPGRRGDRETFYAFTTFTSPATIYRYDFESGKSSVFRRPQVAFDPGAYETRQVFYTSKDGTRVPMFITHRKGIELDGSHPTHLYGYGGFNVSKTPEFSISALVWLEMGGVYAVPNLRGGGEYGETWHQAGTKLDKQNVFDDFIAAAEWLIDQGYTSTPKLAIGGGSNGGLLVGACMPQRPDLLGVALPAVGVLDMLRYHKFTIGWAWVSDYGSSDDPEEFEALYAYSPLHNLEPGTRYPATLITTADHDDRVVPAHSFKFAATLQAAQTGPAPALIRIETQAGHGGVTPTSKLIEEAADRWAFTLRNLQFTLPPSFE
jgi:prolyl oligopeptidase